MPTIPTTSNTASATIAAAAAPRRARPRPASQPAALPARSCPDVRCAARWCRSASTRSTATTGTGIEVGKNPFFAPDPAIVPVWEEYLDGIRKTGSSVGAVVEVIAEGVPAGLGAPIYAKLDQDIASILMSINAVKGVEIGNGFGAAEITGEENADEMRMGNDGKPIFLSNHAGGILGGISTGQPVVARFAIKPTSSILTERQSIDADGNNVDIRTKGRHDPCVGIRAVPIGEAMLACTIADHYLRDRGQTGRLKSRKNPMPLTRSVSSMPSGPSRPARSLSSPTTTTARTKAT